jgi:enamine deaminase RidA (YjgF/YER057c/UK114 family)
MHPTRAQERAFSRAVVTEGGKTVWLGGQTGSPEKNFEGQVRDIFAELDKTIKAVGGTGLKDIVTMTVFINDVRLGDRLTEIRREIFKDCFPRQRAHHRHRLRASGHPDRDSGDGRGGREVGAAWIGRRGPQ